MRAQSGPAGRGFRVEQVCAREPCLGWVLLGLGFGSVGGAAAAPPPVLALAPADETPAPDWLTVRRTARRWPVPRRPAVGLALAVAAVAVPTLALSASVRGLLGLGNPPS